MKGGDPGPCNEMPWPWPNSGAWSVGQGANIKTYPRGASAVGTASCSLPTSSGVTAPWHTDDGTEPFQTAGSSIGAFVEGRFRDTSAMPAAGRMATANTRCKKQYPGSPKTASAVDRIVFGSDLRSSSAMRTGEDGFTGVFSASAGRPSWVSPPQSLRTSVPHPEHPGLAFTSEDPAVSLFPGLVNPSWARDPAAHPRRQAAPTRSHVQPFSARAKAQIAAAAIGNSVAAATAPAIVAGGTERGTGNKSIAAGPARDSSRVPQTPRHPSERPPVMKAA